MVSRRDRERPSRSSIENPAGRQRPNRLSRSNVIVRSSIRTILDRAHPPADRVQAFVVESLAAPETNRRTKRSRTRRESSRDISKHHHSFFPFCLLRGSPNHGRGVRAPGRGEIPDMVGEPPLSFPFVLRRLKPHGRGARSRAMLFVWGGGGVGGGCPGRGLSRGIAWHRDAEANEEAVEVRHLLVS